VAIVDLPLLSNGRALIRVRPQGSSARYAWSSRRRFTDEEKLAIVMETEQPGAEVSAIAR
jgi:transposase-like protein